MCVHIQHVRRYIESINKFVTWVICPFAVDVKHVIL